MKRTLILLTSLALAAPAFIGVSVAAAQDTGIFRTGPDALMQQGEELFRRGDADDRDRDDDADDDDDDDDRGDFRGDRGPDWRNGSDPRYGEVETQAPMRHRRVRPTPVQRIGQVASLLRGPGRSVRGLYLSDGSLVMLRGAEMFQPHRIQPGTFVRVRGLSLPNNPNMIFRATVSPMRRRGLRGLVSRIPVVGSILGQPAAAPPPAYRTGFER